MKLDGIDRNLYKYAKSNNSLLLPGLYVLLEVDGGDQNLFENAKLNHSLLLPGL